MFSLYRDTLTLVQTEVEIVTYYLPRLVTTINLSYRAWFIVSD